MTIANATARATYTASGASGSFAFNYPTFDADAIGCVGINPGTGVPYAPTFTVTLAADFSGCTVAVSAGLTSGHPVVVFRKPKGIQGQTVPLSGPLPSKVLERQLDRAFADIGALHEMTKRSVRAPLADNDALDELPTATVRAGKLPAFDEDGALIVSNQTLAVLEAGSVAAAASAAAAASSAAAADASEAAAAASAAAVAAIAAALGSVVNKTSNDTLDASHNFYTFTNAGAVGAVTLTLPTPVVGLAFTFVVVAAQSFILDVGGSVRIAIGEAPGSAGGGASCASPYSLVTLKAVSSTLWVATTHLGSWTPS